MNKDLIIKTLIDYKLNNLSINDAVKRIEKAAIDVVTLPVDIVKDVATMGGVLTDENKPYTAQKFERLGDDLEEVRDEVDDL